VRRQTEIGVRSNLKNGEAHQAMCHNQLKKVQKAIERLTRSNQVKFEKQFKDIQEAREEMQEENQRCVINR
jgi:exonuclease VII small subunit